jgi:poly(hydroxyalkanoate) depolymerase family esterase
MKSSFVIVLFLVLGFQAADAGQTISGKQTNAEGTRSYKLFLPTKVSGGGMMVVLHGCFLTGDQMATGTDFDTYAEERGFAVLYPEQEYAHNPWKCWNWFRPENQRRDSGEASILVDMVKDLTAKYQLDRRRVFVSGLSAGSAMAANLIGCYSDVFAGGVLQSGLEFAAAQSDTEAHQIMKSGPSHDLDEYAAKALACSPARSSVQKVIVAHGDADQVVNRINSDRTAELIGKVSRRIWTRNGGSENAITTKEREITQPGAAYSAKVTDTSFGGEVALEKIIVERMGHAWSGGKASTPYMDPKGVNITEIAVKFLFPAGNSRRPR